MIKLSATLISRDLLLKNVFWLNNCYRFVRKRGQRQQEIIKYDLDLTGFVVSKASEIEIVREIV